MLDKENKYYLDHRNELVEKYNEKFIVIKDEKVIGVYDSELGAYTETIKQFEVGTFLIQQAIKDTEEDEIYFSRVVFR